MLAIVAVAAIPAVVVPAVFARQKPPALEDLGLIPKFSLIDERGHAFTDEALKGHPTIVSFIFTRCDTICPVTTAQMRRVQDQTVDAGATIKLVSLSVDPNYDTPERLSQYAERFGADPQRWRFLTGPASAVQTLVEGGFMTSMQREPDRPNGVPNIAHGGYFVLVDGALHIRGTYGSSDPQRLNQLMADARYLARTTRNGG